MGVMVEATDEDIDAQVSSSNVPVLIDFGAEWCHPCKKLDPIVEELAGEWGDKVKVLHVDIDENNQAAMKFEVLSVPTLLLLVNGEPVERLTGFVPKQKLVNKLEPHLG